MKTPSKTFFTRALSTAALIAVCAMSFPQDASARDERGPDRGRGPSAGPGSDRDRDRDRDRHDDRDRDHGRGGYSRTRMLNISVQRALASRGYYHGRADGEIGYGTRKAIMRYQVTHRMRPTGAIDGALLRSLRIS